MAQHFHIHKKTHDNKNIFNELMNYRDIYIYTHMYSCKHETCLQDVVFALELGAFISAR